MTASDSRSTTQTCLRERRLGPTTMCASFKACSRESRQSSEPPIGAWKRWERLIPRPCARSAAAQAILLGPRFVPGTCVCRCNRGRDVMLHMAQPCSLVVALGRVESNRTPSNSRRLAATGLGGDGDRSVAEDLALQFQERSSRVRDLQCVRRRGMRRCAARSLMSSIFSFPSKKKKWSQKKDWSG